jgi:hypothetical protein
MVGWPRALVLISTMCLVTSPAIRGLAQAAPERAGSNGPASERAGQGDAAAQFDAGVSAYKAGDFARAAETFLVADGLAPSVTALSNALAAARKAGAPLLMARAAQRTLARAEMSQADKRSARSMLDQVEPKLARIELSCEQTDCVPSIDGIAVLTGVSYVEPGVHRVTEAAGASQEVACQPGQLCSVKLSPPPTPTPTPTPSIPAPSATVAAAEPFREPAAAPAATGVPRSDEPPRWKKRLPLGVFIASGVGALLFGGLSTWQGVTAIQEKKDYERGDPSASWGNATRMAHRSDAFMATGVALAGVAAVTAIWWVDWDAQGRTNLALLPEGGATLTTQRRF